MAADLWGWVEVRDVASVARTSGSWSGFLTLHHLVDVSRELFPLLYQPYPKTGVRALRYESIVPSHLSFEMNHLLEEAGFAAAPRPCFTIGCPEIERLAFGPSVAWPHLDIEIWWRDAKGTYQLKSRAHHLSRLTIAERRMLLNSDQPFDKALYRYIVRHSLEPIEVPEDWRILVRATSHAVTTNGAGNVRIVGFFE